MGVNEKKWYVLRAIGGKEKKVKEYLENEIARLNLEDFISLGKLDELSQENTGGVSRENKIDSSFAMAESRSEREAIDLGENCTDERIKKEVEP